jgi:dynein heavy chain
MCTLQALDDSTTIMGCFKLLDSFENLLEREVINGELSKKHTDIIGAFAADLKKVQDIFMGGQNHPPVAPNCPPRAGAVMWVRGLMARLDEPVARFKHLGKGMLESEEGEEALRAYQAIMANLAEYEHKQVGPPP